MYGMTKQPRIEEVRLFGTIEEDDGCLVVDIERAGWLSCTKSLEELITDLPVMVSHYFESYRRLGTLEKFLTERLSVTLPLPDVLIIVMELELPKAASSQEVVASRYQQTVQQQIAAVQQ